MIVKKIGIAITVLPLTSNRSLRQQKLNLIEQKVNAKTLFMIAIGLTNIASMKDQSMMNHNCLNICGSCVNYSASWLFLGMDKLIAIETTY